MKPSKLENNFVAMRNFLLEILTVETDDFRAVIPLPKNDYGIKEFVLTESICGLVFENDSTFDFGYYRDFSQIIIVYDNPYEIDNHCVIPYRYKNSTKNNVEFFVTEDDLLEEAALTETELVLRYGKNIQILGEKTVAHYLNFMFKSGVQELKRYKSRIIKLNF